MTTLEPIHVPIEADRVLPPTVLFRPPSDATGIYFDTQDRLHGRITFDKLDSLNVSRGEELPYEYDYGIHAPSRDFPWIFKVENSDWQAERYACENENYGNCYEFGGVVEEMIGSLVYRLGDDMPQSSCDRDRYFDRRDRGRPVDRKDRP